MKSKKKTFHLKPLSDHDIERQSLSLSDLWMVQFDPENVHGPFSTEMLRQDSGENPEIYERCIVYNLVTEEWKNFYKLTDFQRRLPKLVPAQNLVKNETFLVLSQGQKLGPFNLEELKEKIQKKEVALNQEMSVDEGKSWIKIYEHHAFDRRARNSQEELPFQPAQDLFKKADGKIALKTKIFEIKKEESSALSGLAFIGRGNDKGQTFAEIKVHKGASELNQSAKGSMASAKWKLSAGIGCVLLALLAVKGSFEEKKEQLSLGEAKETDVVRINNSDRSIPTKKPSQVERRPAQAEARRIGAPKRYQAPARKPAVRRIPPRPSPRRAATRPAPVRQPEPKHRRITHSHEDFENLDIEDPRVREELSRELAGDYYEDEANDPGYQDSQGEYLDDYQEPPIEDRDPYGRAAPEPRYDDYDQRYPEDEYRQDPAYGEPQVHEAPYEELSDFE